jgi:ABC-type multidrug transport system ATPase subunit
MLDYVALPLLVGHGQRRARSRAYDVLARVGMSECASQRWDSLSDGERALVGIAHGIVRRPLLLLVDDPTANLGVREREDVNELLRSLTGDEGLAVLMTAPGMPAAMGTDEITVLSGGRLLTPPSEPAPETNVIDFPSRERSA